MVRTLKQGSTSAEADGTKHYPRRPIRRLSTMRGLLAAALLCASVAAAACPLCLGAYQQSKAQQLIGARQAVLAMPTADPSRFRVIEIIKGERPSSGTIEGGYPRSASPLDAAASKSDKAVLLLHEDPFPTWTILGAIGAEHTGWLRTLAAGKRSTEMNADEWRARVALMVPFLEHREPLIAEIAYSEFATAPYAALLTVKSRLHADAIRHWLADPTLGTRQPLYFLLLGIAGDAQDAARLERQLEVAWESADATNLGPMIAADLQLRGPGRADWVDTRYMGDHKRSTRELEAALLALSVHGNADAAIARERVIQSYRMFMKEHKDIAGYVAPDLAAWRYWDAVPEYVALMKSDVRQQYPSRVAIVAYLRQSPSGNVIELALPDGGTFNQPSFAERKTAPLLAP